MLKPYVHKCTVVFIRRMTWNCCGVGYQYVFSGIWVKKARPLLFVAVLRFFPDPIPPPCLGNPASRYFGIRCLCFSLVPSPPPFLTGKQINSFGAVTHMQESAPHERFLVGCSSPFMRLAEYPTEHRAWC